MCVANCAELVEPAPLSGLNDNNASKGARKETSEKISGCFVKTYATPHCLADYLIPYTALLGGGSRFLFYLHRACVT